jgi:hypothetical protein
LATIIFEVSYWWRTLGRFIGYTVAGCLILAAIAIYWIIPDLATASPLYLLLGAILFVLIIIYDRMKG